MVDVVTITDAKVRKGSLCSAGVYKMKEQLAEQLRIF